MTDTTLFINNFVTTLSSLSDDTDTTLNIPTADAGRLGAVFNGDHYYLTVAPEGNSRPTFNEIEIIKVTAVDTGTGVLTCSRGQQGSAAKIWSAGSVIFCSLTAESLKSFPNYYQIRSESTDFTIDSADNNCLITISTASPVNVTLPNNALETLPVGFTTTIMRRDATGTVTLVLSGTDTAEYVGSGLAIANQYGTVRVTKLTSGVSSSWLLEGDL